MNTPGLWNIAREQPTMTAVVGPDGERLDYAELAARADRYARGLQTLGLRPGDTLAMMLPNGVDLIAVYFAATQIGLYVVPVNWHLVGAEVAYLLADSEAKVFVAHQRFDAVAVEAVEGARVAAGTAGSPITRFAVGEVPGFAPLADLGADEQPGRPAERTLGAPMVYTSGTTGRPKGVRRPLTGADPDEMPAAGRWFFGIFQLQPFDGHVHLCCSPLYHTAVLNVATLAIQHGHPAVLMDRFDAEEMLRLIDRHRVTYSHMVPTQFSRLLALPEQMRNAYDVSSLRNMIHGAAPCPAEVKRQMLKWWGPVVTEYYAATEGGGATITATEWLERPGSVGKAWPGSVIRILDDAGQDVPVNTPGLVYLRMGTSNFEYHGDKEKTQAARVGDLFTLGDIGYLDDEGYLYLCDRKSDMIIIGGVNVYPAEIEGELSSHPAVADVAVFGIPHPEWGEEIKAVVQLAEGVQPSDELATELIEFVRRRLAGFKVPRSVDFAEELPREPNGKLYKRRLRDPYWENATRPI
ncbi:MAG TPA: acyl-CoA synthetase [Kineosporiaceae bacterium]|nr:acyl-CoA synthetase [Kineosporiaceae bacterium]